MLVSLKWLEEILHAKLRVDRLKKISLNLGLEVEDVLNFAPVGIVIGRIEKSSPHPKQKNLHILTIKTDTLVQIVTAARNVKDGDLVLVGPAGVEFNGQKILKKEFAGVVSDGILISEQELGLTDTSTGVIVLERGRPGSAFENVFDNVVLDMSATPNRPDWLSVEGIAREIAIGYGIDSREKENVDRSRQYNRSHSFKLRVADTKGCPRYTARLFENVVVRESPFWMKWRLHCMGMKGINTVVDSTNIMMLYSGQPLHPFDADLLKGGILVRRAHAGEQFVTLEGTTLKLQKDDLVIADREGVIALAGIIGARRGQISQQTKRVVLESAYFDPHRVGHTTRRLGIMTEASTRFERGGDIQAVDRASFLSGKLFTQYSDAQEIGFIACGSKGRARRVTFSTSRMNDILSLQLSDRDVKALLNKVGIEARGSKIITATIPHYRRDLQIEEDIYEEIARVYGYMNIPQRSPQRWAGGVVVDRSLLNEERLKNYLVGQGFSEAYTLSLLSSRRLVDLGYENFVTIRNPLNERFDALRPTLFCGLLDTVNYNLSKGNASLKFFEIGNILLPEAPYQQRRVGLIMGGERYPQFWDQKYAAIDYFDTKGAIEGMFRFLHVKDIIFKPVVKTGLSKAVSIFVAGRELGYLGYVDAALCKEDYFYSEMMLDPIWSFMSEPFYMPPAKFPASTRDLSFLVDETVEVPDVVSAITKVSGPVLERVNLFDYYKGNNVPSGKKNLGFRLYFRAPDRTLTDKEVDNFIKRIAGDVMRKFSAELRTKEQNWTN
jgi:phenylalanyl-tRNA synthetase beta chain